MNGPDSEAIDLRAIRGGFWLLSLRVSTRLLGFVRSVILARILTPADFGLVGMAMIVIAVLDIITQTGFDATLIQKKDPPENLINAAWTLQFIRGVFLFLLAFLVAPWAAAYFHISSLDLIIKFIAISLVITGIRNVGIIFFQKELRFNQSFKFETTSSLVDLIVSVWLAFVLRDVWAIVWGGLAGNVTRLVLSYLLHPYRPRLCFARDQFITLLDFGKWILGTGIVYALQVQIDVFTIGKMLGAKEVGLYQMAMTLATIATTEISYLIRQVTFPTYALLQHDSEELRKAYLRVLKLATVICLPIGTIILALTEDLVLLLFGPPWMELITCLKILVLSGILATMGRLAYPVFLALGLPKYETLFQGLNLAIIALLIFPLTGAYGITGAAWSLVAGNVLVFLASLGSLKRLINFSIGLHLKIIALPLVSSIIMFLAVSVLKPYIDGINVLPRISLSVLVGAIVYGFTLHIIERKTAVGMIRPLIEIIRTVKKGV